MKYKELKDLLNSFAENELDQEVIISVNSTPGDWDKQLNKIRQIEVQDEAWYSTEEGLEPYNQVQDNLENSELYFPKGQILLID